MLTTRKRKSRDTPPDTSSVYSNTETINSNISLLSVNTTSSRPLKNNGKSSLKNKEESLSEDFTDKKPRGKHPLLEINQRLTEENRQLKIKNEELTKKFTKYKTAYFNKVRDESMNHGKLSDKTDTLLSKMAHIEDLLNTASLKPSTAHNEGIHLVTSTPTKISELPNQMSNNTSQAQPNSDPNNNTPHSVIDNLLNNHSTQYLLSQFENECVRPIDPHAEQAESAANNALYTLEAINASPSRQDRSQQAIYNFSNEQLLSTYLRPSVTSPQRIADNSPYSAQKRNDSTASSPTLSTYSPSSSIHVPLTSSRSCKMTLHQHFSIAINNGLKQQMNK